MFNGQGCDVLNSTYWDLQFYSFEVPSFVVLVN